MQWYLEALRKYAEFEGRSRRKEYWMFVLFNLLIIFLLILVEMGMGLASGAEDSILLSIYNLVILLPSIAVGIRRLHDTGRSGWWMLINFLPLIGWLIFLVFMAIDSEPGANQYGPNPKVPVL